MYLYHYFLGRSITEVMLGPFCCIITGSSWCVYVLGFFFFFNIWMFGFSCPMSWKEFSFPTSLNLWFLSLFSFCFSLGLLHSPLNTCSLVVSKRSGADMQICGSTPWPIYGSPFTDPLHRHTHIKHTKSNLRWIRGLSVNAETVNDRRDYPHDLGLGKDFFRIQKAITIR